MYTYKNHAWIALPALGASAGVRKRRALLIQAHGGRNSFIHSLMYSLSLILSLTHAEDNSWELFMGQATLV